MLLSKVAARSRLVSTLSGMTVCSLPCPVFLTPPLRYNRCLCRLVLLKACLSLSLSLRDASTSDTCTVWHSGARFASTMPVFGLHTQKLQLGSKQQTPP